MFRIQYLDIVNLIRAIDKIKSLRIVFQKSLRTQEIPLYGENGLYTNLLEIDKFYKKYLADIDYTDEIMMQVQSQLNEIRSTDFDEGIISKDVYREVILNIISLAESLETFIGNVYTGSTILQVFNFTFQTDTLMFNLHSLYKNEVWNFIPDDAKRDIMEGARGIIVNTPTAAAFMFLRALEGCLRKLCNDFDLKQNKNYFTFGEAINAIENKFKEDELVKRQIVFLRYIKDEFRNPSAHPEKSFSQEEVEQLFQVVNVAINRVYDLYNKYIDVLEKSNGGASLIDLK
jgi:hypothetical protein